jgi:sugar phosphate isomerase/epimerase
VPTVSLEAFLDGAAAAGWRTVGLDVFSLGERRVDDLAEQLHRRGLTCSDVGVLPLGTPDVRGAAPARRLASLGAALSAPVCIAAFFAELGRGRAASDLRACGEILGAAGIRLALEFASYGALTRLDDAIDLCEAVGWERCGVLVDTWHFFRTGEPWAALERLGTDQIALIHVNDGAVVAADDLVHEGRFGRLPVGAGAFPLAEFVCALGGYSGFFSSEVLSDTIRLRPVVEGARTLLAGIERSWPS